MTERQSEYLANGQVEWDVLLLAEMTLRAFEAFCQRLEPTSAAFALDIVNVPSAATPAGLRRTGAGQPLAVTHRIPAGHRMDRIYASPVLEVVDAGVDYDGRAFNDIENPKQLTAGSDHARV